MDPWKNGNGIFTYVWLIFMVKCREIYQSQGSYEIGTPQKMNGWNLKKITQLKREKHLNQTSRFWVPAVNVLRPIFDVFYPTILTFFIPLFLTVFYPRCKLSFFLNQQLYLAIYKLGKRENTSRDYSRYSGKFS